MLMIDADFAPGQRARFKDAPHVEVFIDSVFLVASGRVLYNVVWWDDRQRHECPNICQAELEAIPQEAKA